MNGTVVASFAHTAATAIAPVPAIIVQAEARTMIVRHSMKSKNITVEYEINKHGCPVVVAPDRAFATARLAPVGIDQPRDQITIVANRKGLLTLARWMIALADEESYADHQHFDNELDFGLFKSEADCELIIQRVGK